jgi:preprotein translocase subunit SecG
VAVLWFVFPLLDTLYGGQHLTDSSLHQAFAMAGLFFVFALVLSHIAGKEEREE